MKQLWDCGRTSEIYHDILTLIKKFTPKLNVIKDAKDETLTENDDFWQDGKNTVNVCLRNMAALVPVQQTVMTMNRTHQGRQHN